MIIYSCVHQSLEAYKCAIGSTDLADLGGTLGFVMLFLRTGRLECPETESTNMPVALKIPGRKVS